MTLIALNAIAALMATLPLKGFVGLARMAFSNQKWKFAIPLSTLDVIRIAKDAKMGTQLMNQEPAFTAETGLSKLL